MNPLKPPGAEIAGYLRTFLGWRAARLRASLDRGDRGASAIELAIITAVLVGLAAAILVIIVNFANQQSAKITQTNVPNPGGGGNGGG